MHSRLAYDSLHATEQVASILEAARTDLLELQQSRPLSGLQNSMLTRIEEMNVISGGISVGNAGRAVFNVSRGATTALNLIHRNRHQFSRAAQMLQEFRDLMSDERGIGFHPEDLRNVTARPFFECRNESCLRDRINRSGELHADIEAELDALRACFEPRNAETLQAHYQQHPVATSAAQVRMGRDANLVAYPVPPCNNCDQYHHDTGLTFSRDSHAMEQQMNGTNGRGNWQWRTRDDGAHWSDTGVEFSREVLNHHVQNNPRCPNCGGECGRREF